MMPRPRFTRLRLERLEERNAPSDTLHVLLAGLNAPLDGPFASPEPASPPPHAFLAP